MPIDQLSGREIFLEWMPRGDFMRVVAVDAASGIEAMTIGPKAAARHDLERLVLQKLARNLQRHGVLPALKK